MSRSGSLLLYRTIIIQLPASATDDDYNSSSTEAIEMIKLDEDESTDRETKLLIFILAYTILSLFGSYPLQQPWGAITPEVFPKISGPSSDTIMHLPPIESIQ